MSDAQVAGVSRRPVAVSLFLSLRPRQWTKNLLIFAGLLFGRQLTDPVAVVRASAAFAVFCALSGVVYLVNAMAPEVLADGITYHLGLPYEYTRLDLSSGNFVGQNGCDNGAHVATSTNGTTTVVRPPRAMITSAASV